MCFLVRFFLDFNFFFQWKPEALPLTRNKKKKLSFFCSYQSHGDSQPPAERLKRNQMIARSLLSCHEPLSASNAILKRGKWGRGWSRSKSFKLKLICKERSSKHRRRRNDQTTAGRLCVSSSRTYKGPVWALTEGSKCRHSQAHRSIQRTWQ